MKLPNCTTPPALSAFVLGFLPALATGQIAPPEGSLAEKAIFIEATGGEQLTRATAAGGTGPVLVHDFDTTVDVAASHELDAGQIKLSSGRHLVMYDTQFDATGGGNRAEIQTALTLGGTRLAAGRSQGYIRRTGGADEAVMSGGAIVDVVTSGEVLGLESWRTDTNGNAAVLPTRVANGTAVQLLRLDDSWDYLSLQRGSNQGGTINTTIADVAYDTNNSPGTMGTAFSQAGADITLNESGLYFVFANTSIQKATNNTRTNYRQRLSLDGTVVPGSTTTTYVRGNENTNEGMASLGMVLSASAGQVLNVEVVMDGGGNATGVIQGNETAITMVKLPATTEFLSLLDTTNQEVNDAALDPVVYNTQVDVASAAFGHTAGGSEVTVNEDADYLFFGTIFTQSDNANDNQDRTVPLHGWRIDGAGGRIDRGRGAQYNRDNGGARTSGSWGAAIIPLTNGQSVELTTQRIAHVDTGMATTVAGLQALSCKSLVPSVDPIVVNNNQLSVIASTTGTITTAHLNAIDADDAPADVTYTVTSEPTLGTLKNGVATVGINGTFTQADVDAGDVTVEAGAASGSGGFDFSVADDSGSGNVATGSFVVGVGEATMLADDAAATDEDTVFMAPAPGVLFNDTGTDLSVTAFDATSAQGAVVTISADGAADYDPSGAPALQALDDGESVIDTLTYTVTDFSFATSVANVNVTVDGVNDAPVVGDDSASGSDLAGPAFNVLANDSDVDANDTIAVVSIDGNPVGLAGLTILSGEEATVTIMPDGSFVYDPSTSGSIAALANGASLVDTIGYEVSDGTATVGGTITITSIGALGASNDVGMTLANASTTIGVLGNDDLLGAAGTPTAGAIADFNAADAGNTSGSWLNNGTGGGIDMTMEGAGTQSVLVANPAGAPPGVTAAYDLSGTGSGAQLEDADNTNSIYGGNISNADLALEMVFRSDDLVGNEPLWGSGGNGTGSSLLLLGDQLIFTAGQGAIVLQVIGTLPSTDYVHVVVNVELGTDTAELYINGLLADSSTAINITNGAAADITDWSGSDNEGLGRSFGTTGGDVNVAPFLGAFGTTDIPDFNDVNDRFEGEIAIFRIYSGTVLDANELAANAAAVFGEPSVPTAGDIVNLAGETTLVPGTTVVALPSGATVKLEADGTLTYDPNGAFDHIGTGLEGIDSFSYMLGGNEPASATVVVRVTGTNADPQVAITSSQSNVSEGAPAVFSVDAGANVSGEVTVNLSYSGSAADGSDFTGQASVVIAGGTSSAPLNLATIADSLFENGSETIIVKIDSVTGPAAVGVPDAAATTLDDGDSAPVFTLSTPAGNTTEGSAIAFDVAASVASAVDIALDLTYSGDADGSDFSPFTQVVVPATATAASVNLLAFDDGVADGAESLTATISNPTLGSVGAPDSATATIVDGSGEVVFFADFEGVDPLDTTGGTLLGADAPEAANLGTAIGAWGNVLTAASGGAAPGLILEIDDVKGDGVDTMLRQDRPFDTADGALCAIFDGAIDISGGNSGTISFDIGQLRTLTPNKNTHIIGLDDMGTKSFEIVINGDNAGPSGKSLYHADSSGTLTQLSPFQSLPNTQDIAGSGGNSESAHANIRLGLTSTGYTIGLDHPTIVGGVATLVLDGVPDVVTGELPYAGTATVVTKILFQIAGSTDVDFNGGLLIDNVSAAGTKISAIDAWRIAYFGSAANSGPGADGNDANGNGLSNLLDFAFGLDPVAVTPVVDLEVDSAGNITQFGGPTVWIDPADGRIYLRYPRRSDYDGLLNYDEEFSRDLTSFEDNVDPLTVIGTGSNGGVSVEAVQVEFPSVLPVSGGKARDARVEATLVP